MNKFAELQDIEVFEAGTYRGVTYDDAKLDEIVKNTNEFLSEIKPVAVIGHDEEQDLLKQSGLFSAGWMLPVKKVGTKIVASFKDVPQVLAELINKGAFKRISSEIYNNYNGKGLALRRVAILGGDIPEVKTLQDIAALYAEEPHGETTWLDFHEGEPESIRKEKEMEATKLQEQITTLSEAVTKLQEEGKAKDERIKALESEKEAAITKLSETQKAQKKTEIHNFCETLKRDGKVIPAMQDLGLESFMESLDDGSIRKFAEDKDGKKVDELSQLGFMKKFLDSFGKIVHFGEAAGSAKGAATGDDKKAKRDAALAKYKEEHPNTSSAAAWKAVSKQNPELFAPEEE